MAMPQCCYLAKGAKRPSHTPNTIKFDRIPFYPCNSIKRFDLSPFDQKNSTYLQPPSNVHMDEIVRSLVPVYDLYCIRIFPQEVKVNFLIAPLTKTQIVYQHTPER